ncbi:MAG: hypothetical protein R2911_05835 [Caldilineaceae bacterium]
MAPIKGCGQFNERVATFAIDKLNSMHIRHVGRVFLAVGERVAELLAEAEQNVEAVFPSPSSITGITPLVRDFAAENRCMAGGKSD